METEKKINLLSNEPCREDAFEGHAHENIAVQVARIIREDDKRHIIGIEGGWGSGKSNLISLVNKALNGDKVYDKDFVHKDSSYPFFVYDAWGHQADYQRRAILEELTAELTNQKKILDSEKWNKKLEELLAKRRKTTTKEVPRLGIGLIVSIVMTILTPLVVYVVGLIPVNLWWLKLIVAVLPYIAAICYAVIDRIRSLKKNDQKVTTSNILSELILVYKDQIKENETYTTISEKEPSSAEFKAWMDDVDKDLVALGKNLVIVFDNMDRLPSQKVESLWSSIHSFFSDKTYNNIKVIIPFDRQHVQQAFKGEDAEGITYGNDFINKTFDVVFRVPPPIMSGWKQYMADKWKEAFGSVKEIDIAVTQIYDALNTRHTPRNIIAFINEMATIKMTMEDVPDRYIALFVLGKEKIDKAPITQLLAPDYMEDVRFEYANDPDTIKYLSALYYQLPVEQALDVVFTQEAVEALNSGSGERLINMMDRINLPAILGNAILKVSDVEKATAALAAIDKPKEISDFGDMPDWLIKIWDDLFQKCKETNVPWNIIKEFHAILFKHLYSEELADLIVSGYLSIEDDKWDAQQYVLAIDGLKENNDIIDRKLEEHKRVVSPKLFMELLKLTDDEYESYGVACEMKEVDAYLATLETKDVLSMNEVPFIGADNDELPQYKAKLQEWLGDSSNLHSEEISGLFSKLKEVSDKPISFADFFGDDTIYSTWNDLKSSENPFRYDLIAMRLARRNNIANTYTTPFNDILENSDDSDAEALAKVIEYYLDFGDLVVQSGYYKDFPLAVSVMELLINNSYGVKRANVMECLKHFDQTVNDYEIEAEHLYVKLNDWISYVKFTNTKIETLPSGLIEIAGEVDNKLSQAIHKACEEHYDVQTQDQWKDHILKKDNTYRIWKIYHPKKYQSNFDALKSVLKDYANGTSTAQPAKALIDEWLGICLEVKHSVKGLFNDIASILKRDSMINKAQLLYFGEYILDYADSEKQQDFVEKLIPSEIIDSDVVGFIAGNIDKLRQCPITEEFKEKISHLAQTSMKEDERIWNVCRAFGVEVNNAEGDTEETLTE